MRQGVCSICSGEGDVMEHHISYTPEKKIVVCDKCHREIHHSNSELKPDKSTYPSNIRRLSFEPTDGQRERIKNLPRKINLSAEMRKALDKILDKAEKEKAQVQSSEEK